jgi:hypothetical protein
MAPVIDVTREYLLARRNAILDHLGVDEQTFWTDVSTRTLSSEEWESKEELEEISFLLGTP